LTSSKEELFMERYRDRSREEDRSEEVSKTRKREEEKQQLNRSIRTPHVAPYLTRTEQEEKQQIDRSIQTDRPRWSPIDQRISAPIPVRARQRYIESTPRVKQKIVSRGRDAQSDQKSRARILPLSRARTLTPEQKEAERGIARFFTSLVRGIGDLASVTALTIFSGVLGAALFPAFGPVAALGISLGVMGAVREIQQRLKPLDLDLQDDTIRKLVEPFQEKTLDEKVLRKVIADVLTKDRQANDDLAKAYSKLGPMIEKAATTTNIQIIGDLYGATIGNNNTVTNNFHNLVLSNPK
jgi:hypothetical protein